MSSVQKAQKLIDSIQVTDETKRLVELKTRIDGMTQCISQQQQIITDMQTTKTNLETEYSNGMSALATFYASVMDS
jgi:hypothetical protein